MEFCPRFILPDYVHLANLKCVSSHDRTCWIQNVCKYTKISAKIWYLNFLWNHSFKTIYLYSIGKLLAFGWPNKRRINFILEHSAMRKGELYPQERCISGVYIYPQMSSPMLSPLSAWGLYKLASARVSRSEIGFTCNNDVRSYFYNLQQTWNMNMNNNKNQTLFFHLRWMCRTCCICPGPRRWRTRGQSRSCWRRREARPAQEEEATL